jgi:hypothetical protein
LPSRMRLGGERPGEEASQGSEEASSIHPEELTPEGAAPALRSGQGPQPGPRTLRRLGVRGRDAVPVGGASALGVSCRRVCRHSRFCLWNAVSEEVSLHGLDPGGSFWLGHVRLHPGGVCRHIHHQQQRRQHHRQPPVTPGIAPSGGQGVSINDSLSCWLSKAAGRA